MKTNWITIDANLINTLERTSEPKLAEHVNTLTTESFVVNGSDTISEFKVYQRQKNINASTSISVAPFFKGDGSYDDFTFSYFAGAFSDRYRFTSGASSAIVAERFGFGIEVDLKITKIKSSIRGGFGMIAAAIEMGLAEAEYSYHIKALPEGEFQHLLPKIGKFDADAIQKFSILVDKLKELYTTNMQGVQLVAMEVLLANAVDEEGTENAASYYFAARRIIEEYSLRDAIKKARQSSEGYNEDAIQYLYSRVGIASLEEKPSSRSINEAKQIIFE